MRDFDRAAVGICDRKTVVLDGHEHTAGLQVADRMVGAAVSERELERLETEGEPQDLVTEADTEHRSLPEQFADRLDRPLEYRRVAGTVADEDGSRNGLEDRVCAPIAGNDHDLEPAGGESHGNRALRAEIEHGYARARTESIRLLGPNGAAERTAVDRRLGQCARVQLILRRLAERAAKHAAVANRPDEFPRVDVLERDHSLGFEPLRPGGPCLAHHDRLRAHAA